MASEGSPQGSGRNNLSSSGLTIPSDSENYDGNNELSSSPPESNSSSPLILYKPPTLWGLIRGAAINLLLPFVNGLMLGFGELVANEAAFRLGWSGTKVIPEALSFTHFSFQCVLTCQFSDLPNPPIRLAPRRTWRRNAPRPRRTQAEKWTRARHVHCARVARSLVLITFFWFLLSMRCISGVT